MLQQMLSYPAVPLASVLCINICLHQWLDCTDKEGGRVCPHHCMCYCFLLYGDFGQCSVPPLSLAPPILLLTCCPPSPCIILSYFSPPLSPAALCIVFVLFFPLHAPCLSLTLLTYLYSPLPPNYLFGFLLRVLAYHLTILLSC